MPIVDSIATEFRRYQVLADAAIAQVTDEEVSRTTEGGTNSIAIVAWHIAGNLRSRFTDFLTTDGEKPWRQREEEFDTRQVTRREVLDRLVDGWSVLFRTLDGLTDADLDRTVTIRGEALPVHAALHRSLAHASYHVGQIVHLARSFRGDEWTSLSIPRTHRSS